MQWIKEWEMVDSVDDLMFSSSMRGIQMPNFEVLDARIASALNRIIHNFHFKRRISLEQQKAPETGPFPLWQADCLLDLRVLSGHWEPMISVENYTDLFTIALRNDEFRNSIRSGMEFCYQ